MLEGFEGTLINENDIFQEEMKKEKKMDDDKSEKSIIFDAEEQLEPVLEYHSMLVYDKYTGIV